LVITFHPVNKGAVYNLVTTRGWVIAAKVPVAGMIRAGYVQVIKGLIKHFHLGRNIWRGNDLGYPVRDFLIGKWRVDSFYVVLYVLFSQGLELSLHFW
jgi:hypothetical protein